LATLLLVAHPLLDVLLEAARGRAPAPDGRVDVLPALAGPVDAIVTFTARAFIVADVDPDLVRSRLRPNDPGAPTLPAFVTWLADQVGGRAGQVDVVLAAPALEGPAPLPLDDRDDMTHHHRVARAGRYRTHLRVVTNEGDGAVLVIGRGLAGRWEAAFEVAPERRGRGAGRALALAARHLVPPEQHVFVQVSPGNAASLRAVLAAGYRPIGSEVLIPRG